MNANLKIVLLDQDFSLLFDINNNDTDFEKLGIIFINIVKEYYYVIK
jgi:hypothetical protein